jgi:hypothetical protein
MTWAGKQSEQPRSFQSPETYLLLTFPFIERGYRTSGFKTSDSLSSRATHLALR